MIWFLSLFTREYEQRQALLIIFLASSFWGVLWVPMRHIEAMGLSGLWVVVLFHFLPAGAISFPARRGDVAVDCQSCAIITP